MQVIQYLPICFFSIAIHVPAEMFEELFGFSFPDEHPYYILQYWYWYML